MVFDLDADGSPDRTAWTAAGAQLAFLAGDRNGTGQIDDGSELFGNHTWKGARNGFEALAEIQFAERGVRSGIISEACRRIVRGRSRGPVGWSILRGPWRR